MGDKRYYWLKLKEDFFQNEAIEWLEEQENGKEYCLFYLKLCLKSLKDDGLLIRSVGNFYVPYTAEKLAEITKSKIDTVIVGLELLKKIGLVEIKDDGGILMTELKNMVGSEMTSAERKRKSRANQKLLQEKCDNVTQVSRKKCDNVPKNVTTEIRDKSIENRDKSKEIREEKNNSSLIIFWEQNITPITPVIADTLTELVKDYGEPIVIEAIKEAAKRGIRNIRYVEGVAHNMFTEGPKKSQNKKKQDLKATAEKVMAEMQEEKENADWLGF